MTCTLQTTAMATLNCIPPTLTDQIRTLNHLRKLSRNIMFCAGMFVALVNVVGEL